MGKILIKIIFFLGLVPTLYAQINITGDAYYQTDIVGYMGRRNRGCGDIDGLRSIKVYNSTEQTLFNGREIYYPFDVSYTYNKNNPITRAEIKLINRWKTDLGSCDKGPDDFFVRYNDLNFCYSRYEQDAGHGLRDVTVSNRPIVKLDTPTAPLYLGDLNRLRIALPDHLTTSQYRWKYKVGNGSDQTIPAAYNGRSILEILGKDFLRESDFGENVAVWLEMGCDAGEKLAEGIAKRKALVESTDSSITGCPSSIFGEACRRFYYQVRWPQILTPEHIAKYQSQRSNPIVFRYLKSSPTIHKVEQTPVSCRNATDGKVKIFFNTNLLPQEKFTSISLKKGGDITTQLDISVLSAEPGGKWSYTFPDDLASGIYEVELLGSYKGVATYTDGDDHTATIEVTKPSVVQFDITEIIDSRCDDNDSDPSNNNDGEILITAYGNDNSGVYRYSYQIDGGGFSDWVDFNSGSQHRMRLLKPADYEIKVQKYVRNRTVECIAYILNAGEPTSVIKVEKVTIKEPKDPVQIVYTLVNEPRAFGFEDGRISARIFGGTPLNDGSYTFEWKNEAGQILNTVHTEVLSGDQGYAVTLHSVGAGTYYLNAWDAKYEDATYTTGCFQVNSEYNLEQPDPLEVVLDIYNPISCNIDNEYNNGIDFNLPFGIPDQFQDGALVAHVKGGVPFAKTNTNSGECRDNFMPYCYRWKKNVGGTWQDIAVKDSIIENQSVGTYALNVEDKNGIVLATYEEFISPDGSREYRVVTEIDSTKYLSQPDKLEISFTSTVVTCLSGNDAQAAAIVTGGTSPYTYEWSTGETTSVITNLIAGTYLVFVTDAKGCQLEGRVKIIQPNGLDITAVSIVNPTCFEGNDGKIEVEVTGGNPPYSYVWNTGSTTTAIDGLSSGIYRIEVTDTKGCKAFYEVQLADPEPIIVAIEKKRSLCGDQSLTLDIGISDPGAVYSWSSENGFTSTDSSIEISKTGIYTATITSSLGCIGTGSINVEVLDIPIEAYFLIATQGYTQQDVILVNISDPLGDKVEWTIPEGAKVISETSRELVLQFENEGAYTVNLRSYQKDCYQDFTETIFVLPAIEGPERINVQRDFIEEFIVFPNPNGGAFKTKISLAEDANITIKIIDLLSGATIHERSEKNNQDFLLEYSVTAPAGVYLILLETPKGTAVRKLVFE